MMTTTLVASACDDSRQDRSLKPQGGHQSDRHIDSESKGARGSLCATESVQQSAAPRVFSGEPARATMQLKKEQRVGSASANSTTPGGPGDRIPVRMRLPSAIKSDSRAWKELSANNFHQENEERKVYMNVVVLNLADISTSTQSYTMRLELWVAWALTEEEVRNYIADPDNWKPNIHPQPTPWTINIEETTRMPFLSGRYTQVFMFRNKVVACECTLVTARFLESMELVNFPFDSQHFNFHIGLRCDCDIPLMIDEHNRVLQNSVESIGGFLNFDGRAMAKLKLDKKGCTLNVRTHLLSLQDFILHNIECEIENMERDVPFLHCSIRLSRNYQPYVFRVFVPMSIIMVSSTLAFRFDSEGALSDRLSFVATIMLTVVAFMFILSGALPQIPYLTLIDKYMTLAFGYVGWVGVMCVLLNWWDLEGSRAETTIFAIGIGFSIILHVALIFVFRHFREVEMRKLSMDRHTVSQLEDERLGQPKDRQEFLVHTDIHPVKANNVHEGTLRCQIAPEAAAGWLFEGQGRLIGKGELRK